MARSQVASYSRRNLHRYDLNPSFRHPADRVKKRKAQNRAAQRAFRDRKERHLKDLETKVEDLEKASQDANQENEILRAKVDRLQTELKEYRQRISLDGSPKVRASPQSIGQPNSSKANWDINSNFQFEFPNFGPSLMTYGPPNPSALIGRSQPKVEGPPRVSRQDSQPSMSPVSYHQPSRTSSYSNAGLSPRNANDLTDLFSPSVLAVVDRSGSTDYLSFPPTQSTTTKTLPANASTTLSNAAISTLAPSEYNTASPSASSVSHRGLNSSCNTTPEPSAESPDPKGLTENDSNSEEFRKQSQGSSGNTENSVPGMEVTSGLTPAAFIPQTPSSDLPSIDWLATQNGGMFDPVLFGDYRDPQETVMNGPGMNDFFDAAFPGDLQSPITPLEPALPSKQEIVQRMQETQEKSDSPGVPQKQYLTCNMLW